MLRKRLIFTLIYCDGYFIQSRNFRLQKVGDINWLKKNYKFKHSSFSIDELIVLDASRTEKMSKKFLFDVEELAMDCLIPLSVGGGVDSLEKCKTLFSSGADKIVLNSSLTRNVDFVNTASNYYGTQSIVGSIDVRKSDSNYCVYIQDGKTEIEQSLLEYLVHIENIGVGEIYLNSIDRDGTGFGFDLELVDYLEQQNHLPLIIAGGAGNYNHFIEVLKKEHINAASTANLFNFMGDGLAITRTELLAQKINLSNWENE